MAKESTIQHYTSSTTGNTPSAVDLASGELAINIADEKVFLKNLLGNVVSLSQSKDLSGAFASKATVVTSFNGLTGAVTGVTAGGINTFTALNTFSAGISSSGITGSLPSIMSDGAGALTISAKQNSAITPENAVITLMGSDADIAPGNSSITLSAGQIYLGAGASQIYLGSGTVNSAKLVYSVNGETGPVVISARSGIAVGNSGKNLTITNSGVTSFNGLTGAVGYSPAFASSSVTGVASFNSTYFAVGATGVVTLASAYQVTGQTVVGGTGISVSKSGNTSTVTNIGVQSIDGATGAIVNIAKTDVNNNFAVGQTINGSLSSYDGGVEHQITLSPSTDKIIFLNDANGNTLDLYAGDNFGNQVISFPTSTTTRAGIGVSQTFTATNTFNALQNFTLGISASGATFSGNISAPNIVTVGTANTFTALQTFSAGISAAGATFAGNVKAQSTLYTDNILAIGNQINIANVAGGRIAFGDYDGVGNSTYVFIRDATSSLLISNPYGDVGIGDPNNVDSGYALLYNAAAGSLDGGNSFLTNFSTGSFNGLLTANGGISAAGATFSGPIISTGYQISSGAINAQTASYSLVAGDNGKIVTMNVASANNLTVPASLAVGFNCTIIQLGAGQTTILASGTTLNSYQGYLKISGQHGSASIVGYTSNVYNVAGNLSA